jgi:hypothetical protein
MPSDRMMQIAEFCGYIDQYGVTETINTVINCHMDNRACELMIQGVIMHDQVRWMKRFKKNEQIKIEPPKEDTKVIKPLIPKKPMATKERVKKHLNKQAATIRRRIMAKRRSLDTK